MHSFAFSTAGQILFGKGALSKVGELTASLGRKALITSGCRGRYQDRLEEFLGQHDIEVIIYPVCSEPSIEIIEEACQMAQKAGCDVVIGFGGGSALDTAKAVAVMRTNPGELMDYLEVVGRGQPLQARPAPWIGIPTTAGTGSEVTRNAVITTPQKVKVSLRSPWMQAVAAIIDPELTYELPPEVTASTGMDALAQVIEPYVSRRANPITDLYCREGIQRGARALLRAYRNGQDDEAREDMAFTSLMGGLALANAGLGAVHGFAGPIGGMFAAPHGAVCASLLAPVVLVNVRTLSATAPDHVALARYAEIAQMITGRSDASGRDLARWLEALRESLNIPRLRQYGVREDHAEELVDLAAASSSMKANPIQLSRDELLEILHLAT